MNCKKNCKGFTLVEMCLVSFIFALIVMGIGFGYKNYSYEVSKTETKDHIDYARNAIREFRSLSWRYPCPANPTLAPSDANYGVEDCTLPAVANLTPDKSGNIRDADGDGFADSILIGTIPFKTISDRNVYSKLGIDAITDGWGRQITYVVTKNLTDAATYNSEYGAIGIWDENNRTVVEPENTAHMLLLSHGQNGIGAYTLDGKRYRSADCNVLLIQDTDDSDGDGDTNEMIPADINERENCDDDGLFLLGIRQDNSRQPNDDFANFYITQDITLWDQVSTDKITNSNDGSVGVGIRNPSAKLHIDGSQRFDENGDPLPTSGLKAEKVRTTEICDSSGYCIDAELIGGEVASMKCPSGQAMYGISEGKVMCKLVEFNIEKTNCDEGLFLQGISNTKGLICVDPYKE